jgi:hypothetical protein
MELLVSGTETTAEGLLVHGIMNKGAVYIGSVFTHVIRRQDEDRPSAVPETVKCSVRRIVAYRHALDQLEKGMGGSLLVDVQALDVKWGDLLGGPDASGPSSSST